MTSLAVLPLLFASSAAQAASDDHSMADTKIVLQISDNNPFKQTLVLNVANNLIAAYGQDLVKIEIVAFGPGLRLLFDGNANTNRIQSLADRGVRFSACSNTIRNMGKKIGHPPALNSNAVKVSAGVVRIIDLERQGYMLIKP
jgi:intracellular sulfur oxidation DsrE/DsrF family protein